MNNQRQGSMISGMLWIATQKIGVLSISFISNIILARILDPTDFGIIGILMVFTAFADIFIDGGLTSALIQKGNPTKEDYSGVFIFNLIISSVFYLIIFCSAPFISNFFDISDLAFMLRVMSLILLINALSIVQLTKLQVDLKFKQISTYNLFANFLGLCVGVFLAIVGWGVWSLIFKTIITSVVLMVIVWYKGNWMPVWNFSFIRVFGLFKFGGYIFISTFIEYVYAYLQPILIGKFFSVKDLGLYNQARKLEEIPTNSILGIINVVTFPIYSKIGKNLNNLIISARKTLQCLSYIAFPIMIFMIVVSEQFIVFLLGEKWIDAYPLLQILCIAGIFRIPSGCNMNIIKSIGKSKGFMYIQIIKRIIGIVCIVVSFNWGLIGLMWGFACAGILFFVIDSMVCGYYTKYGLIRQSVDMFPYAIISLLSGVALYIFLLVVQINSYFIFLVVSFMIYVIVYILLSAIFRLSAAIYCKNKLLAYIQHSN